MATAFPFRKNGGWLREPVSPLPSLDSAISADVIVVGAGFAGLNTALELKARGADVVVLERDHAGFGASGRNAGYLAGGQGLEYELFTKRLGHEQSSRIVAYYDEGVAFVERKLAQYGIDCDYLQTGIIRAAVHPSQEVRLRSNMEEGLRLGTLSQFLDERELRERDIPSAFLFGSFAPNGGTLDPGKYVLGLRRAAIDAGIRIFEGSPLLSFEEGTVVRCITPNGTATAPHVVLATNAYTPQLDVLRRKVVPLRVSAIETTPLTSEQMKALGWQGREGIVTPHMVMESHRLTARNTLVLTTKRLDYVYGSATPNVPDDASYGLLAGLLGQRFPQIGRIDIASCWSGYISFALDALPVVTAVGEYGNIHVAAGCSGHGVGTQSLAGEVLADRITGHEHPFSAALEHKTPGTPPEPLQWAMMKSALGAARLLDAMVDRRVRRATR